jgi:hypothetical protein
MARRGGTPRRLGSHAVSLREGLPGFPDEQRIAFMAAHRAAWTVGWRLWQLAAISLMAFYAALAMRIGGASRPSRATSACCRICAVRSSPHYRELEVLIGCAANGLYTIALLLLVIAGWRVLPLFARMLTLPVILSGLALAIASLQHD